MLLNREKLSEVLGCSLRTIDDYKRQGMPGDAPKRPGDQWRFDSAAVVEWLRDRERADALGEVARVTEDEAKRRKLAAEASLAEFELALKQGSAVAILDFESSWAAMIGAARAKFLGLGMALGPEVALIEDPSECATVIESAVKEALRELSEFSPDIPVDHEGEAELPDQNPESLELVESTTKPDGKRVGRQRTPVKSRIER
jgi:terminase small subunit / prophage DNA-packing protein